MQEESAARQAQCKVQGYSRCKKPGEREPAMTDGTDDTMFGLADKELDERFAAAVRRADEEKLKSAFLFPDAIPKRNRCTFSMPMDAESTSVPPEVMVIADPNGSGRPPSRRLRGQSGAISTPMTSSERRIAATWMRLRKRRSCAKSA